MNHNIPEFKALVRRSWFTKDNTDFDTFDSVFVFGLQSVQNKILTFHVMTDYGMLRSRVPLSEIFLFEPKNDVPFHFKQLWDSIKPSGVYVVEDVCTSYWEYYGGERYKKDTMMEYFKGITDEVNFFGETLENFDNVHARREDKLIEQFKTKGYDYIGTQIESINFLNGIIIITKR